MTSKKNPARDTFQSHVYSRPPGDLGFESFNVGKDVRARSDRSVSPILGRQGFQFAENYFPVQNVYEVAPNLQLNTATMAFTNRNQGSATAESIDDYIGDTIELTSADGTTKIFEIVPNGGSSSNIGIEIDGTESMVSFLGGVANTIRSSFPFNQGNMPFKVEVNGLQITITDLQSGYGVTNLALTSPNGLISSSGFDTSQSDSHEWYLKGQRRTSDKDSLAFMEDTVSDLMTTTMRLLDDNRSGTQIVRRFRPDQGNGSNIYPTGDPTTLSEGDEYQSPETLVAFETGLQTVYNNKKLHLDWHDEEWWHGKASSTWDSMITLYGYSESTDVHDLLERYLGPEGYLVRFATPEDDYSKSSGEHDVFNHLYSIHREVEVPYARKYAGIVEGDRYEKPDMISVANNQWETWDQQNKDHVFEDLGSSTLIASDLTVSNLSYATGIPMPIVTDLEQVIQPKREFERWSRTDNEMLEILTGSMGNERAFYSLSERYHSNTGTITSQGSPAQGIIYTGVTR